jgi:hypothetical protein
MFLSKRRALILYRLDDGAFISIRMFSTHSKVAMKTNNVCAKAIQKKIDPSFARLSHHQILPEFPPNNKRR